MLLQKYTGLHLRTRYTCQISIKFEFSPDFLGIFKYKFYENPFNGSQVSPYRLTEKRTDMKTVIGAFRKFWQRA